MERDREALFQLLRVALTGDCRVCMPTEIDWTRLIHIANTQGVAAIAFDGLQKLTEATTYEPHGLGKMEKLKWFAASQSIERSHERQLTSASELSRLWHTNGIRTLVLKGFAFASYYPLPCHRPASDMDCYLCGRYEAGNKVVELLGIRVDREDYRHSTFMFKDVYVENHKICTTVRGLPQRKRFEASLRSLLENEKTQFIGNSFLEKPCDRFNALYFLQHAHRHFLREGITLRHICDWAMIINRAHCFDADFWAACHRNDLKPFAETMTRLAYMVCGVQAEWLPNDVKLEKHDMLLLEDCFCIERNAVRYGNHWKAHLQMVNNMLSMRWKYKFFSNRPLIVELLSLVWSNWFEKNPEIPKLN